MPSQVISNVRIHNADWAATPDIPLNSSLVAIIDARGSGKTTLVDVITTMRRNLPPPAGMQTKVLICLFGADAQAYRRRDHNADLRKWCDYHARA